VNKIKILFWVLYVISVGSILHSFALEGWLIHDLLMGTDYYSPFKSWAFLIFGFSLNISLMLSKERFYSDTVPKE